MILTQKYFLVSTLLLLLPIQYLVLEFIHYVSKGSHNFYCEVYQKLWSFLCNKKILDLLSTSHM